MIRILSIIAICFCSLLLAKEALAQVVPTDTEQSLLPEIDPQDIEIRSQFQARFPGLRRQPILGFNPRPRVFQTDPNRMPFIESEDVVAASLPVGTLDRPEPPVFNSLGYSTPRNAFFRGGIGSEISPEADLYAMARLGDHHWISGNTTLRSSNGHEELVATSYRYLDVNIKSFNRLSKNTDLNVTAGLQSNFNHMLQLNSDIEPILDTDSRVNMNGFNTSVNIHHSETSLSGFNVGINGYSNRFETISDLEPLNGDAGEWGVEIHGDYSRLGNRINEIQKIDLQIQTGSTRAQFGTSHRWAISTLSGKYERLFNYRTDVKASLGFSGVRDAFDDFIFYLTPKVEINHRFFTGFNIRGLASGTPSHVNYSAIQQENRFFDFTSDLKHQYEYMLLGEVLLEPFYGTKILGGVSFQDVKNFMYYSRSENPAGLTEVAEGFYTANFSGANILRVYGGFSQDLKPEVIWVSADGFWQIPKLSSGDKIPYAESISLKASVSIRPVRDVLLEGWGEFSGNRENHLGDKMSSYTTIGGRFEISISDRFGVYGKLLNLLNEEFELWEGFTEQGFRGFAGFTILF